MALPFSFKDSTDYDDDTTHYDDCVMIEDYGEAKKGNKYDIVVIDHYMNKIMFYDYDERKYLQPTHTESYHV